MRLDSCYSTFTHLQEPKNEELEEIVHLEAEII